jgi:hypothetical protein
VQETLSGPGLQENGVEKVDEEAPQASAAVVNIFSCLKFCHPLNQKRKKPLSIFTLVADRRPAQLAEATQDSSCHRGN